MTLNNTLSAVYVQGPSSAVDDLHRPSIPGHNNVQVQSLIFHNIQCPSSVFSDFCWGQEQSMTFKISWWPSRAVNDLPGRLKAVQISQQHYREIYNLSEQCVLTIKAVKGTLYSSTAVCNLHGQSMADHNLQYLRLNTRT